MVKSLNGSLDKPITRGANAKRGDSEIVGPHLGPEGPLKMKKYVIFSGENIHIFSWC